MNDTQQSSQNRLSPLTKPFLGLESRAYGQSDIYEEMAKCPGMQCAKQMLNHFF